MKGKAVEMEPRFQLPIDAVSTYLGMAANPEFAML
jgi:hypothetical protein